MPSLSLHSFKAARLHPNLCLGRPPASTLTCSAPSCAPGSDPLNGEGRGTYRIEGGTSVHRRAETTGPGTPGLLLLILHIHVLPEEDLEMGRRSHEPGSAQLSQQSRGWRCTHPSPPALDQRRLPAALRHHLARLLPIPPYTSRPRYSRQHLQLLPCIRQMARALSLLCSAPSPLLLPPHPTLFSLELTPKRAETHSVVTTGPWSSKDTQGQPPRPSLGQ